MIRPILTAALALLLLATQAHAQRFAQRGKVNINNDPFAGPQKGRVNISGTGSSNHQVTLQRHGLLGRPRNIIINSGNGGAAGFAAPAAFSAGSGYGYQNYSNNVVGSQLIAHQQQFSTTNRLNSFAVNPYAASANMTLMSPGYSYLTAPLAVAMAPTIQQYQYTTTTTQAAAPIVQQYIASVPPPTASLVHSDTTTTTTCETTAPQGVGNVNYLTAPQAVQAGGCYHSNPAALLQNRQYQQNCAPTPPAPVPTTP